VTIAADTSSTENIFIDDVQITGAPVPEPSMLTLASLAVLRFAGVVSRRRRRS